jgi:Protein of unknown function (DUF295)
MEATKIQESDWSSLLPEMLNLIARNLSEISDFVRFRAVCRAWRLSTPITDQPPQFPWILERSRDDEYWDEPYLRFYSIPSNKIHTIHASNVLNKRLSNRALEGHLLLWHHTRQFSLINPLNNDDILLPAFPCEIRYRYWVAHQQNQKGDKSFFCGFHGPDSNYKFAFCHTGQDNWCELKLEFDYNCYRKFYLKGMLFIIEQGTRATKVIDISTGSLFYTVPPVFENPLQQGIVDLVEVSGDILRVHQFHDQPFTTYYFDIHRMDAVESGSPCWVDVKNIGDHALFIDNNCCFALRANSSCGIKANCIYYFKKIITGRLPYGYSVVLERVDIMTDARELLPCPFKEMACWFAPTLHHL